MELSQVAFVFFLLTCTACQPIATQPQEGALPTPPFSSVVSHHFSEGSFLPPVRSSTLDETISSIQHLTTRDRTLYRRHLEELATQIFHLTALSQDQDAVIMALLAAASSHHPFSRSLSRSLLTSSSPIVQLTAVQALAVLDTSDAASFLIDALRSDYPIVRLEAAWQIAQKRISDAFFHLDALSYKLPPPLLSWMPELFALEGSSSSVHKLHQLLFGTDESVVVETLLAIGRHNISSFEEAVVNFQSHSPAVLEAVAFSLRNFDSENSRSRLLELSSHQDPCVRIQAALSLTNLGDPSHEEDIIQLSQEGNLFALSALQSIESDIPPLSLGSRSSKINLAVSLLEKKNCECIPTIVELLCLPNDEILSISRSVGESLSYIDVMQFAAFPRDVWPTLHEQSLRIKEALLTQSLELPESDFLAIARSVFASGCIELYPCLIHLLENQRSQTVVDLLREEANRVGAPYNRAFATVALVNLGIETDETNILPILDLSRNEQSQPWRFPLPWMVSPDGTTPQQHEAATTRLYIEAIDTLAQRASDASQKILTQEVEKAPMYLKPCIVSALLHASL